MKTAAGQNRKDLSRMEAHADDAARLLQALGNPQRLRILCLLIQQEMTVGQIHQELDGLSQSALSQHLACLRRRGLVQARREQRHIWYRLAAGPGQRLILGLAPMFCPAGIES